MRLLNGEFQEEVAKSMVSDPGKFLKRRRGNSRVREQRKNRRDTLGIVPAEFVFPPWAGWLWSIPGWFNCSRRTYSMLAQFYLEWRIQEIISTCLLFDFEILGEPATDVIDKCHLFSSLTLSYFPSLQPWVLIKKEHRHWAGPTRKRQKSKEADETPKEEWGWPVLWGVWIRSRARRGC